MKAIDFLNMHAIQFPFKKAIIFNNEWITYLDLNEKSKQTAVSLLNLGIRPGDRVGIFMNNCLEHIILIFAIIKIGAIEVNLITDYSPELIKNIIELYSIKAVIYKEKNHSFLEYLSSNKTSFTPVNWDMLNHMRFGIIPPLNPCHEEQNIGLILFTSGTTGFPKGVAFNYNNFIKGCISHNDFLKIDSSLKLLNILPLSHSCGKSMLFESISAGGTMILEERFVSPLRLLKIIQSNEINHITAPPFIFHCLSKLNKNKKVINQLKKHLRTFEIGLSSISPTLIIKLREIFNWVSIFNRYGMTENASAASVSCITDNFNTRLTIECSCGKGLSCTEIEVIDGNHQFSLPYEIGDIVIRGSNLMIGYWEDLQKGIYRNYKKDWFYTGDKGMKDEEGFIYVNGRSEEFVNVMGNKVYLGDVSSIISHWKEIKDVVAVGIPDEIAGANILLFVVPEDNCSIDKNKIEESFRENMPSHMIPSEIIINNFLPKTASGKINIWALQKMAQNLLYGKNI